MNTTRDSKGRYPNSRRRRPGPLLKGRRYVVTTVGDSPDDLVETVSRTHAAALAMVQIDLGTSGHPLENGLTEEHGNQQKES